MILKYSADEARSLKAYGELPESAKINETDTYVSPLLWHLSLRRQGTAFGISVAVWNRQGKQLADPCVLIDTVTKAWTIMSNSTKIETAAKMTRISMLMRSDALLASQRPSTTGFIKIVRPFMHTRRGWIGCVDDSENS